MRRLVKIERDKRLIIQNVMFDKKNPDYFFGHGMLNIGGKRMSVVFGSDEGGKEHVSVDPGDRDPTWAEMCAVKEIFWQDEEECIQIHPKKSEYVNKREHCLHIWRRKDGKDYFG